MEPYIPPYPAAVPEFYARVKAACTNQPTPSNPVADEKSECTHESQGQDAVSLPTYDVIDEPDTKHIDQVLDTAQDGIEFNKAYEAYLSLQKQNLSEPDLLALRDNSNSSLETSMLAGRLLQLQQEQSAAAAQAPRRSKRIPRPNQLYDDHDS